MTQGCWECVKYSVAFGAKKTLIFHRRRENDFSERGFFCSPSAARPRIFGGWISLSLPSDEQFVFLFDALNLAAKWQHISAKIPFLALGREKPLVSLRKASSDTFQHIDASKRQKIKIL